MDGVIVDSNGVHREAWIAFNARYGLATTEEMLSRMYGKRNDDIVRDFFGSHLGPEEVLQRGAAKEALYREMMKPQLEEHLVPGLRNFLASYPHIPTAIATNGETANVDLVIDGMMLRDSFRVIVDGHQVTNPKPHPDIYLRAAQLLGVAPSECVVFEDSSAGVAAGLAAGMPVIGIRTTHPELPGTAFTVADFLDPAIGQWLAE